MDNEKAILIIGAGPAGLGAGYELAKNDVKVTIVESENHPGGIARTVRYKNFWFDLGGHRFFSKNEEINNIWQQLLGNDFLTVSRLSRIYYANKFFFYPIKFSNALFNLGIWESFRVLVSYICARLKPIRPEVSFADWVSNRFGPRLFEIFFKTYTEKVWGIDCRTLSRDWAAQRIKGLSFSEVVKNSILRPKRTRIKTLISQFHYPVYGPGMMWEAIVKFITEKNGDILYNKKVTKIVQRNNGYEVAIIDRLTGKSEKIFTEYLISSMPLNDFLKSLEPAPTEDIKDIARRLSFRSFLVAAMIVKRKHIFPDQWIYIHSPEVLVGRIQNVKNWSSAMVPEEVTLLGMEYFCNEGDNFWNQSDEEIMNLAAKEIVKLGFARPEEIEKGMVVRVKNAYPVYYLGFKNDLEEIRKFIVSLKNVQVIGRSGLYRYNNMDHSMLTGIYAARNYLGRNYNVWDVNIEEEYLEER